MPDPYMPKSAVPDYIPKSAVPDQPSEWMPKSAEPVQQDDKSLLGQVWDKATTPLVNIRSGELGKATDSFAEEHPIIGGIGNFLTDSVSQLSSPLDLTFMGLSGGASLAEKFGLDRIASGAKSASRALSVPVAAHGAYNVYNGETYPQKLVGGLELAGGLMGMGAHAPTAEVPEGVKSAEGVRAPVESISDQGYKPKSAEPIETTKLYRWQSEKGSGVPDWMNDDPKYQASQNAAGSWYTDKPENIDFYKKDAEGKGKLVTIDVTPEELAKYKVTNNPEAIKFSADPNSEYFIPKEGRDNINSRLEQGYKPKSAEPIIEPKQQSLPITNPSELPAVQKLMGALNEAIPKMEQQSLLYSEERAKRFKAVESVQTPGVQGFYEKLSKLKGELPKVDTQKFGLNEEDIDSLVNAINDNKTILTGEKIRATSGLMKLLTGSEVPQRNELGLLGKVFGNNFSEMVMMHGGLSGPLPIRALVETSNLMKSVSASMDLSAPLRQGLPLIHKAEYWGAFSKMFSMAKSEDVFQGVMKSIEDRPNYLLGREAGLKLTEVGADLSQREEAFLSKQAEKIPGIRASERGYVGFINKLRADTFDSLVDNASKAGLDVSQGSRLTSEIANYVNVSTGRGSLGRFEKVGTELNALLFSPRLLSSRLTILNPNYYIKADPFVRKEALKSLLAIGAVGTTTLGLNEMAGGSTSANPLSADFGKARQGDTRADPWGGFQQYIVAAARFIQGKTDSNSTGAFAPTRKDIVENFAANKLSPMASLIYSLTRGRNKTDKFGNAKQVDPFGNELNVPAEIGKKFAPMLMQDMYDIYQSDPNLLPMGIGAAFGMGMQTYSDKTNSRLRLPR